MKICDDCKKCKIAEMKQNIINVANSSGNFEDMLLSKIVGLESVLKKLLIGEPNKEMSEFNHELLKELSGGEIESLNEREEVACNKDTLPLRDDSKPPEPKIYSEKELTEYFERYEGYWKKKHDEAIAKFLEDIDGYLSSLYKTENSAVSVYWTHRKEYWEGMKK